MPRLVTASAWVLCALLTMMVGCQAVTSQALPGEPEDATAKTLQGVWQLADTVIYVKAVGQGQVSLAIPKWEDDRWQLETHTFHITRAGDALYASLHHPAEGDDPGGYQFLRLIPDNNDKPLHLTMLHPNIRVFAQAVDEGKIEGTVRLQKDGKAPDHVHLTASAQALTAFLDAAKAGVQFNLNQPLVLRRLAGLK